MFGFEIIYEYNKSDIVHNNTRIQQYISNAFLHGNVFFVVGIVIVNEPRNGVGCLCRKIINGDNVLNSLHFLLLNMKQSIFIISFLSFLPI